MAAVDRPDLPRGDAPDAESCTSGKGGKGAAPYGGKGTAGDVPGVYGTVPGEVPGTASAEARNAALGQRLYTLRRQRGWSQELLAEKSGVSAQTIRGLEINLGRKPFAATLVKLSLALGLPKDYLSACHAGGSSGPSRIPELPPVPESSRPRVYAKKAARQQSILDVIADGMQEILSRIDAIEAGQQAIIDQLAILTDACYPGMRKNRPGPGD